MVPSQFEQSYRQAQAIGLDSLATVSLPTEPADARAARDQARRWTCCVAGAALVLLSPLLLVVGAARRAHLAAAAPSTARRAWARTAAASACTSSAPCTADAEQRLAELACYNEVDGAAGCLFKIKDDPRITPVGRFLRRWSMDELPQFWNVFKGDMSIVGPRPPLPGEVDAYDTGHLGRLKGKPGITGLWQVSGRSDLPFEKMVDLDTFYLENWSLTLDVSIMLRTALVVVRRQGAY